MAVDDEPNSCAELYMMAEKTWLFNDQRTVKLIISSPNSDTHKRTGRGVKL